MSGPEVVIEAPSRKPFPKRAKEAQITTVEMTKSCARDLTDRIKAAVDDVSELLWRAHEGGAWQALGYESWKQYCEAEFQISERHSYRLLDFVEVKNVLTDQLVSPKSESQVRPLTQLEPEQQPVAWGRAVEIAEGEQPTAKQVEQAVQTLYPVVENIECSPAAAEAAEESEKEGWALSNLKFAWKKCGKKDRQRFLSWIIQQAKAKNER